MSEKLSLKVEASRGELDHITAAVEELGEREDWPPALVYRVHLVIEELLLNIADYGYDGGVHEVEVNFISESDALTIEIVDDGRPFDPLSDAPLPDVSASADERPIGGLGIHLVKNMMDDMRYRRENGKNHLTMVSLRNE